MYHKLLKHLEKVKEIGQSEWRFSAVREKSVSDVRVTDAKEPEAEFASASKTKIDDIISKYQIYDDESNNQDDLNVKILSEVFSVAVKCVECGSIGLKIENTKNIGLCSPMKFLCNSCNLSDSFMYSPHVSQGKDVFDVNLRLTYGLSSIGKGRRAASLLRSCEFASSPYQIY